MGFGGRTPFLWRRLISEHPADPSCSACFSSLRSSGNLKPDMTLLRFVVWGRPRSTKQRSTAIGAREHPEPSISGDGAKQQSGRSLRFPRSKLWRTGSEHKAAPHTGRCSKKCHPQRASHLCARVKCSGVAWLQAHGRKHERSFRIIWLTDGF